ncbi:MAG: septum formation family protein [Nitriliruptoraceae bacterium]
MRVRTTIVALAVGALVLVACGEDEGNVFELTTGQCFDDPEVVDGNVRDVPIIDCEQPHDNEVFALVELPGGDHPGTEVISDEAGTSCLDMFPGYVGVDYDSSEYYASFITPSENSWQAGDRTVICYLYGLDGPLEGSSRGTAR